MSIFSQYYQKSNKEADEPLDTKSPLANYNKVKTLPVSNVGGDVNSNLLKDYSGIQTSLNDLFASKYGIGNYDVSKGWAAQTTTPLENWSDLQENNAISEYSKYTNDMSNANLGMNEYNAIKHNQTQAQAQNNIIKEQAEKYLPDQLRLVGYGDVGQSEKNIGGIQNYFANSYNQTNENADTQANDLFGAYKTAKENSQLALENEKYDNKAEYQDNYYTAANNALSGYETAEQFQATLAEAKTVLTPSQYKALLQTATQVAKELGFDLVNETIAPTDSQIQEESHYRALTLQEEKFNQQDSPTSPIMDYSGIQDIIDSIYGTKPPKITPKIKKGSTNKGTFNNKLLKDYNIN